MNRIVAFIISLYIASFLYTNVFFIKQLTLVKDADQLFWNHLAIFAILLVPIYLLVSPVISASYDRGMMKGVRLIVLAVCAAGLTISILLNTLNIESVYALPSQIDIIFNSD